MKARLLSFAALAGLTLACGGPGGVVTGTFQANGVAHTPFFCRESRDGVQLRFQVFGDPEPLVDWILIQPDGRVRVCGLKGGAIGGHCFEVGPAGCAQREGDRVRLACEEEEPQGEPVRVAGELAWSGCAGGSW